MALTIKIILFRFVSCNLLCHNPYPCRYALGSFLLYITVFYYMYLTIIIDILQFTFTLIPTHFKLVAFLKVSQGRIQTSEYHKQFHTLPSVVVNRSKQYLDKIALIKKEGKKNYGQDYKYVNGVITENTLRIRLTSLKTRKIEFLI